MPESLRQALASRKGESALLRRALKALVAEAVREALINESFAGRVLGLSFDDRRSTIDDMRALRLARSLGAQGFGTLRILQQAHALGLP